MVPLGIQAAAQASTVIAVEVGANWINGGYMALLSEAERLAQTQAQLLARQAARDAARANSGGNYYTVSDAPDNTVSAPMQDLNRLSQNAVMGYDPAAFSAWQAANPNGVNLSDPKYAGIDPTQLSQWAARNPHLMGAGAGTFTPDRTGFTTGGGSMPTGPGLPSGAAAGGNTGGGLLNAPGGMGSPGLGGGFPAPGGGYSGQRDNSAPSGGTTGGASGGMFQGVDVNSYQQNPYLAQMGTALTGRITDNLNRNIMPGIRSNAIAAGGFGGSRQGVVEANALNDANRSISDALTGVNFQDFTNQMNRNLQQYGQNQNFYTNQRGQDLSQTALGANLFQQGNQGFLSQGQGIYGLGTTQQQAPWQTVNNANAGLGQWSGYGSTTSANTGGGSQGVLGGALAGGQMGRLWGGSPNAAGGSNTTGWGTGAGFGNQDFGQFF